MAHCHEMQLGQVWWCKNCGFEIKVHKECKDRGDDGAEACGEDCTGFECCGEEMELKK
jgi:hypothetical protein